MRYWSSKAVVYADVANGILQAARIDSREETKRLAGKIAVPMKETGPTLIISLKASIRGVI